MQIPKPKILIVILFICVMVMGSNSSTAIANSYDTQTTYSIIKQTIDVNTNEALRTDTINLTREDFEHDICEGAFIELAGPENMISYEWSTGEPFRFITVNPSVTTDYWVDYETPEGPILRDNHTVFVHPYPVYTHSEDTVIAYPGQEVTLWIEGGFSWLWSTGNTESLITEYPEVTTSYNCVVSTVDGCSLTQEFYVIVKELNVPVETVCKGESITLSAPPDMNSYLWSTNETTQSITFSPVKQDLYWVEYETPDLEILRDSTFVTISLPPVYTHSPDQITLGPGQSTTLWVSGGDSWKWSDNSTDSSLLVTSTGSTVIYWCEIMSAEGCVTTHEFTVSSKYFVIDDATICQGDSITLSAPLDMQSYEWSTGSIEQSITVTPEVTTLYWVEVVTPNLVLERDSALITVLTKPEIIDHSPESVSIVPGDEVSLWIHAAPGLNYLWSTGSTDTLITVSPTISTTYWVDFSNEGSCVRRQEYFVKLDYPSEAHFTFDTVCFGKVTTLINRSMTTDSVVDVSWDLNSDGLFDDAKGDTVIYAFPEFNLFLVGMRLTFKSGSLDVAFNSVPVGDAPLMGFTYESNCVGSTTSFLDKSIVYVGDLEYRIWEFGDGIVDTTRYSPANTHYFDGAGAYSTKLIGITTLGCKDSITNTVNIVNPPWFAMVTLDGIDISNGDTTSIADGDSLSLTVKDVTAYDSIIWNGTTNSEVFHVTQAGSYQVYAYNSGCSTSQEFHVKVGEGPGPPPSDIEGIMSLFTPNGDGINDYWTVNDPDVVTPIKVTIYNRYGNLVFSDDSYNNDWDGTFKNNPLPQSTYYYIIEDVVGHVFKGPITIIR